MSSSAVKKLLLFQQYMLEHPDALPVRADNADARADADDTDQASRDENDAASAPPPATPGKGKKSRAAGREVATPTKKRARGGAEALAKGAEVATPTEKRARGGAEALAKGAEVATPTKKRAGARGGGDRRAEHAPLAKGARVSAVFGGKRWDGRVEKVLEGGKFDVYFEADNTIVELDAARVTPLCA